MCNAEVKISEEIIHLDLRDNVGASTQIIFGLAGNTFLTHTVKYIIIIE